MAKANGGSTAKPDDWGEQKEAASTETATDKPTLEARVADLEAGHAMLLKVVGHLLDRAGMTWDDQRITGIVQEAEQTNENGG